jgi:hypothetical protein
LFDPEPQATVATAAVASSKRGDQGSALAFEETLVHGGVMAAV